MACERPTLSGDCFSAAVISDGSYDLPEGIICGMPLMTTSDGKVEIVRDITLSDLAKEKIKISTDELIEERSAVEDLLT
jgi:malate dehydrogenase